MSESDDSLVTSLARKTDLQSAVALESHKGLISGTLLGIMGAVIYVTGNYITLIPVAMILWNHFRNTREMQKFFSDE